MKTKKNAGFSLVELIVVIAIMAVLVGVLAPAYLKYVEKSRKSSDISAFSDIINATTNVASDTQFEADIQSGSQFIITVASGAVVLTFDSDPTAAAAGVDSNSVASEWASVSKGEGYKLKSKEFKAMSGSATGTVQKDNSVKWSAAAKAADTTDVFAAMRNYSPDFDSKFDENTASEG